MYYLYVLRCADGTLYTGITVDLARRLREHTSSTRGAKYLRGRGPLELVYQKKFRNRSTASRAETAMKGRSRKEKLHLLGAGRSRG